MKMLVVLEHRDGALTRASAGVLSHVASLGESTAALVVGSGVSQLAPAAGRFGATRVFVADDARLAAALPQPRVDVVAALVRREGFDAVVAAQSVLASDLAAGLAVRLDAGINWDLVALELAAGRLVGRRPALEDSVWVEVGWSSEVAIALVRPGVHDPLAGEGRPELHSCVVEIDERSLRTQLTSSPPEHSAGPSIEDAEMIVAGGRGLGGPGGAAAAGELADALGAGLGATRASVDAGWYPSAALVGQTGKTVSPKLYIALGISGAIQHKVGMRSSGTIVAINTDPAAPIFALADLGVVGDLHTIVPRLAQLVREARGR